MTFGRRSVRIWSRPSMRGERPRASPSAAGASWSSRREREPEPAEHGGLEPGHGADPIAAECEDVQALLGRERGLAVGARRRELEPPVAAEDAGTELGGEPSAFVLE